MLSKDTALHQLDSHTVDHGVTLNVKYRKCVARINKASGIVVRSEETTGFDDAKPVLPGYVNQRYKTANKFDVSDSWLVDTGCPNELFSEE